MAKRNVFSLSALLLTLFCTSLSVKAQEVESLTSSRTDMLSRSYLRPSLSVIFATDGSSEAKTIAKMMRENVDSKFDQNDIVTKELTVTATDVSKKEGLEALQNEITAKLEGEQVGRQIMHCWFPEFNEEQKGYVTTVLEERGQFAATDADIIQAEAAQRDKHVALTSLGEQLIDRSYVVVYYVYKKEGGTFSAGCVGFVYKLDFNAAVMDEFYTKHYASANGIDAMAFPLKHVYTTKEKSKMNAFVKDALMGANGQTEAPDYNQLSKYLLDNAQTLFTQNIKDFAIKTPIIAVSPIRAKIGTKENLRTDQRFYVVENVLGKDGVTPISKRRGAVRVGSYIADNNMVATGKSEDMTKFYQYSGGRITEGMTLVAHPDLGIGITPLVNYMYAGVELDYRASDLLGKMMKGKGSLPGLYSYFKIALPFGTNVNGGGKFGIAALGPINILRYTIGVRKELNFSRMLTLSASAGVGSFGILTKTEGVKNDLSMAELSLSFGAYVNPSMKIFVSAGYDIYWSISEIIAKNNGIKPFNFGIGTRIGL